MDYFTTWRMQRLVDEVLNREPMAGIKAVKHFVFSRFFTWRTSSYPYDIFDPDFLSTQLPLTKNMLKSLENQTNKDFEMIFLFHAKVFDDPKYEFIFSALRDSTTLPLKFMRRGEEKLLIKEAFNEYDFVIQTRMDFDDFVFKDAVEDAQRKINECENLLAWGYWRGYRYICKELVRDYNNWKEEGHHSIFQSLIMKSSYAKNLPPVSVFDIGHYILKLELKKLLEKNSFEFSENMFQQDASTNAYIYFKHEFSADRALRLHGAPLVPPKKPLTTADITRKELEEEFGFFYDLNSIE